MRIFKYVFYQKLDLMKRKGLYFWNQHKWDNHWLLFRQEDKFFLDCVMIAQSTEWNELKSSCVHGFSILSSIWFNIDKKWFYLYSKQYESLLISDNWFFENFICILDTYFTIWVTPAPLAWESSAPLHFLVVWCNSWKMRQANEEKNFIGK